MSGREGSSAKPLLTFRAWRPPSFRRFNRLGFWTHYFNRGVLRFFNVLAQ